MDASSPLFLSPSSNLENPPPSLSLPAAPENHQLSDPDHGESQFVATEKADGEGSRAVNSIPRKNRGVASLCKAAIGVRVSAAALCLIAFSVMAADKNKGWAVDSYDRYSEYRYCVAVNVIGFVYATFQIFAEVHRMNSKKHIIGQTMGYYFDFAMDQILSYLLISASSSATSRTNYWVSNWGVDPFTNMIGGSVTMSFLAFIAFSISSLISAYTLFSARSH